MQSLDKIHKSTNTLFLECNKLNITKHKHNLFNVITCAAFNTDFVHIRVMTHTETKLFNIQGVPGEKVNILGGHSFGHSKEKCLYEHVSYSERFPRWGYLNVQPKNC